MMTFEFLESTYSETLYAIEEKPMIIIDKVWSEIGKQEIELLTKIVNSIGKKLDAITVHYQAHLDLNLLPTKPRNIIYFGKPISGISPYEVVEIKETKLVASDRLEDLEKNDEAKKKLWQALKKQFLS